MKDSKKTIKKLTALDIKVETILDQKKMSKVKGGQENNDTRFSLSICIPDDSG